MFRYNLLIAFRHLLKNKVNTLVNVFGLAISLTAFILLGNFVYRELTTDRFHENADRIFAVSLTEGNSLSTPAVLSQHLNGSIPGIEKTARCQLFIRNYVSVQNAGQAPLQSKIIFADSSFFDVFSVKCLEGNLKEALNKPYSLVLTKSEAQKIFGPESPIGKSLTIGKNGQLTVNAIIEDLPSNSSFDFTGIADMNSVRIVHPFTLECGWQCFNVETYILLSKGYDLPAIQQKLKDHFSPILQDRATITLVPYKDLYFDSGVQTELRHGNMKLIRILLLIGILIIVIALINYINLSTSQSNTYAQNTGIKKLFGSGRMKLIGQFMAESTCIALIAYCLAVFLSNQLPVIFNPLLGISLRGISFFSDAFWLGLLGTLLILGPLAGVYPACFLTTTSPIMVIKNEVRKGKRAAIFRKGLIIFQFSVSITLIICTLLINRQLDYVTTSNPGFRKENLLLVRIDSGMKGKYEALKQTIRQNPSVKDVAFSLSYPGNMLDHWTVNMNNQGEVKKVLFTAELVDAGYIDMMGIEMTRGRGFQKENPSDEGAFILNETAVREYGLKDPLNITITDPYGKEQPVIGVVKDYHFESLHNPIKPLALMCGKGDFMYTTIRYQVKNSAEMDQLISSLEQTFTTLDPSFPFEAKWFDSAVEQLYLEEKNFKALISIFSGLAILVACLGLFALSLYETENKIREIGIRKVNGASVSEVMILLNKDFVKWVVISFIIASPLSYYAMGKWLEGFAYKTGISVWLFIVSGIIALTIALITVSWQSWSAATRNPVKALRHE